MVSKATIAAAAGMLAGRQPPPNIDRTRTASRMKSRSPASMAPKGAAKPLLRLRATLSAWCATSLPVTPEKGGGVEQTGAVEMNGQGSFLREVVDSPHRRERHHGAPRIDVRVLRDDQRGARTLFVALSNGTLQIRDVRHAAPPGHGDRHGPGHRRHGPRTRRRSHGSLPRRRSSRRDDRKYERLFDCKACTWGRRGRSPSRACRPPTPPGDRRWGPPSGRTRKGDRAAATIASIIASVGRLMASVLRSTTMGLHPHKAMAGNSSDAHRATSYVPVPPLICPVPTIVRWRVKGKPNIRGQACIIALSHCSCNNAIMQA